MGAVINRLRAFGLTISALPDDRIEVSGPLTDGLRAMIREHKAAILAELAANDGTTPLASTSAAPANHAGEHERWRVQAPEGWREVAFAPPADRGRVALHYPGAEAEPITDRSSMATPEQAAELRRLVAFVAADWPAEEQAEALAVALADPADALVCFRAPVAEHVEAPPPSPRGDDRMRTCRQCANLAPGGRCLAAWRGESFGAGIAISERHAPEPDLPLRCFPFRPLPDDPDQRPGADRWPMLMR